MASSLPSITSGQNSTQFPISRLPPELRDYVYTYYLSFLPPIKITPQNAKPDNHTNNPLVLSSPFFRADIKPSMFYSHTIFTFSCPMALNLFASHVETRDIRNIAIIYERHELGKNPDWVHLILSTFRNLERLLVDADIKKDGTSDCWWECVKDAVREGHSSMRGSRKTGTDSKGFVMRTEQISCL